MKLALHSLVALCGAFAFLSPPGMTQVFSPSLSISPAQPTKGDVITATLYKPAGSCVVTPSTYAFSKVGANLKVVHNYPYASSFELGTCSEEFVLGMLGGGNYQLEWSEGVVGQEVVISRIAFSVVGGAPIALPAIGGWLLIVLVVGLSLVAVRRFRRR